MNAPAPSESPWLFGYGSLIWRPDFPYLERRPARVRGWTRRFWQGSHDHRGVPDAPGRVVTLVPDEAAVCDGVAYHLEPEVAAQTWAHLDHREKNGYERHPVDLDFGAGARAPGVVYIATRDNHAFLGPAPVHEIVAQIRVSAGPSGTNLEYLLELARALRSMDADDPHVFEIEARLREAGAG